MPADADEGDSIGRGSSPLFWAQVVGNAGLLVAVVPIARELGPTGRGTVAFITVTAIIAATLARLGVTEATTVFCARRPAQRPALLSNVLLSVSVAALVAALVVCGTLELVPQLRPPGIGDAELAVLAGAMFASGLADAGYMFVLGCSRFRLHALVTATAAWLYAGTMWLLMVTGEITVVHATLIWVVTQAAKAAVLLIASVRAEGLGRPDRRLLRESLAFGVRAWIGTLSSAFNERLDQILVALLASEAVLGIYATAVNAFDVVLYLAAAAATAMVPLVARADPALRTGRVLAAFRAVALVTVDRDRACGGHRARADPAGVRPRFPQLGGAVPVAVAGRARLRCTRDLLERARRVLRSRTFVRGAARVTRARHRARLRAGPAPGRLGGRHRGECGPARGRRRCARALPTALSVPPPCARRTRARRRRPAAGDRPAAAGALAPR